MKRLKFDIEGRTQSGFAQPIGDKLWIHFGGRTFTVQNQGIVKNSDKRDSRKALLKSGNIVAPMPGKITKILVKIGDTVDENQSIIVMEAMKMEYALKAQVSGLVKEIYFSADSQVPLGAVLAVIEKAKDQ